MSVSPMIVLFSSDLMLISSVGGAAAAAGHRFSFVSNLPDAAQKLADAGVGSMLCLDLSSPAADAQTVASTIAADVLERAVAFGPHVHTARLKQAKQAGFSTVMSRGQFVSKMSELFAAIPHPAPSEPRADVQDSGY